MPLHKIKDFDPDYHNHFDNQDIMNYDVYSGNEKIGSVSDLLVDDNANFRYLVINTGIWVLGKKVLLPIGRAQISHTDRRIYVNGLTKAQVESMPEYDGSMPVDYNHEEQVRGTYRPMAATASSDVPVDATTYDRNTYNYDREPGLYGMNDRDHQNLKLYEERLIASKTRQKTGEVIVGKHVETETQHVSVPVERERIVVERTALTDADTPVTPGAAAFQEGEVARVEAYEETPDIRKEAFVREQVNVRKEVDRDTVETDEQIRREELDIQKEGRSDILRDQRSNL
jgi:uncharacterized protein (TIGR02271 family)